MRRVLKIKDLLAEVEKCLQKGKYLYTGHAHQRLQKRVVTRQEVRQVLRNGYHEKRKDEFIEEYNSWNYSIKGTTIDKRVLRVIVSFDSSNMLIITIIDLNK